MKFMIILLLIAIAVIMFQCYSQELMNELNKYKKQDNNEDE